MELNFHVNGAERKRLVQTVSVVCHAKRKKWETTG